MAQPVGLAALALPAILETDGRLSRYRAKRDPARTPEPFGGTRVGGGRLFMVHKHAARRLHYDLRLEMGGVLASWAVPKGPPVKPRDKRLAVHVEDHPLEYGDFEGVIPEGNYGAGPSLVWDRGVYRLVDGADPLEGVRRGKLDLDFAGFKMRGRWALVRTSRGDKDWLLIKKPDPGRLEGDDVELTERYPESVISGLTIEELREGASRLAAVREQLHTMGAPRGTVTPTAATFMLATVAEAPPDGPGWLFEIKYDGVRVAGVRSGRAVELYGRSGQATTVRYPEIVRALAALPIDDFVLDGEIVALDESGRPSFQLLQYRMLLTDPRDVERAMADIPVTAVFYDCLGVAGHDLRALPLTARKDCLRLFLPRRGVATYGDHVAEHGRAFFEAACGQGLEGVVAKRAASAYQSGRSRDWLKVKCQLRQEFVIGGYTRPEGGRPYFGALHLGVYDQDRLVYVGKVGTGFDVASLKAISDTLAPLRLPASPFEVGGPAGSGHTWVEPKVCAEVRFTQWTRDGAIRHPAFIGLRADKVPKSVVREQHPAASPELSGDAMVDAESKPERAGGDRPARGQAGPRDRPAPEARATRGATGGRPASADALARAGRTPPAATVRLTNLTKVFWPTEGVTKGDLIAYYDAVAPLLLPYLRDRPLVLTRYPDGIAGKSFYQKDAPAFVPDWIRTVSIHSDDTGRDIAYLVVDSADQLRYVINMGTIPLHLWASRVGSLDRPDWLVLDLDPKGAPFSDVIRVAHTVHDLLDDIGLESEVKTSGATGLHILLPLGARHTYEEARGFAHLLATLVAQHAPEVATVTRAIRGREGKVYVDWGQNGRGQTIAAPFSARPRPGATVSCPLRWSEVTGELDPDRFTIKTVPRRFARMSDPLAPVLTGAIDMARAIAKLERRYATAVTELKNAGGRAERDEQVRDSGAAQARRRGADGDSDGDSNA